MSDGKLSNFLMISSKQLKRLGKMCECRSPQAEEVKNSSPHPLAGEGGAERAG
jgi:hypothetical protein